MANWDKLKRSQHEAWILVETAVTKDEQCEGSSKRNSLAYYQSGLEALKFAKAIDISGITDVSLKRKAVRLKEKIDKNIEYVTERITFIKSLPPAKQPVWRPKRTLKPSNVKPGENLFVDRPVPNSNPKLKDIDPKLADAILSEIVKPVSKSPSFEDVIGLEECKSAINEAVILPTIRPDIFTGPRVPPKGVLLFGPPGNGKTFLGKAVANEAKSTFFSVSAATLMSKWVGESERLVRALFSAARQLQPSIIFIDECDSLLSERKTDDGESTRRVKTEFLLQADGLSSGENDRVVLLVATNRPWDLDSAVLRRLPRRIYLPLPETASRSSMIRQWMSKNPKHANLSDSEIESLARKTEWYSAADLTQLLRDAALQPIRELPPKIQQTIELKDIRPIIFTDVCNSMSKIRPVTHTTNLLNKYATWNDENAIQD